MNIWRVGVCTMMVVVAPLGQTLRRARMLSNLESVVETYAHVASGEFGSQSR